MSANAPLHIAWRGVPFTLYECQLACALKIYVKFEDGTIPDDQTIGQVIGTSSGLQNMDCGGLVAHLRATNDIYPEMLAGGEPTAIWATNVWNTWLDPCAGPAETAVGVMD
ncbi:hypothetical protein HO173_000548 [Letharia columbiana]|uniref:Uncharacterized protein n=1 Tax=Letharia columbiana TaxID=112416 RepID=A0A8H6G7C1_9LECA|nr:uncharacterized protein HO173_000548 [Letharia columbiana]KAF6241836.1 hypothetical protein HO173_000548 [Letharia columbiana]